MLHACEMLSCNIGNYLIKCQSERYIIIIIIIMIIIIIINPVFPGPGDQEIVGWCPARDSLISWEEDPL